MNPRVFQRLMTALGAMAMVSGCDLDSKVVQSDGRTAGGSDEIDTRIAVDRTGKPVVAARIALVKTGDSSGTALAVSATGSDGAYPTFVVPDGYYSLLVRDSSGTTGRYVDSVRVVSRKLPTGRDTLLSLGSVSGVVRLLSGDSPTSVRLGLVGTDILSSAKSDGTFKIDLVPGGLYTLGAESSLDGYDRIYRRIQLKDGQNLVLPDTLVLPFSGLRVPDGLDMHQDTATGNVRVSWDRVDHPDLMGYVVERVEGGVATYSRFLTDTIWMDTLGAYWERLPLLGPWPDRNVTYRVRSRSVSGAADTRSVAFQFQAKPPQWTRFVGDPTPRLIQDSTTGNVQVTWPSIRHPQLRGYVVDRIEDGGVQSGPILADTIFIDSLGAYWESLPLLGPWPERKLDYRIRLIAKEDGIEVFGDSTAMDAKPPAWTKHVDSVKVTANRDSVTGVTTLRWNVVQHPDLNGWEVVRTIDGLHDCSGPANLGTWNDDNCTENRFQTYDTGTVYTALTVRLLRERSGEEEYLLRAVRRNHVAEVVLTYQLEKPRYPGLVEWRDSGVVDVPASGFMSIGGWMTQKTSSNHWKFSQDGVSWESFPEQLQDSSWRFVGKRDSAWMIRLHPDSVQIELFGRQGAGVWSRRSIASPFPVYGLLAPVYDNGVITYFGLLTGIEHDDCFRFRIRPDGIRVDSAPRGGYIASNGKIRWTWSPDGGYAVHPYCTMWYESDRLEQQPGGGVLRVPGERWTSMTNVSRMGGPGISFGWNSGALNRFIGPVGEGMTFVQAYQRSNEEHLVYFGPGSDSWLLPDPPGSGAWAASSSLVFLDEIWVFRDGHLWKGKLNLPK